MLFLIIVIVHDYYGEFGKLPNDLKKKISIYHNFTAEKFIFSDFNLLSAILKIKI